MSSELSRHLDDYLRLRRSQGFKLVNQGLFLAEFVVWMRHAGATRVTAQAAITWARRPQGVTPNHWANRLGAVRGFARYLHTIDPATEIPGGDVFPAPARRADPYQYTPQDVARLLGAAGGLRPTPRAVTYETLFGLLAATGMRIGETLALRRDDVELDRGVITVLGPKGGRVRLVPLHPSTTEALRRYTHLRDRLHPNPHADTFFVSTRGTRMSHNGVRVTFINLTTAIGLRTTSRQPRIHDLRHSFAVAQLLRWYRSGAEVAALMPRLSTYLGHVSPASTYWYVTAVPELMHLAAQMLGTHLDDPLNAVDDVSEDQP